MTAQRRLSLVASLERSLWKRRPKRRRLVFQQTGGSDYPPAAPPTVSIINLVTT